MGANRSKNQAPVEVAVDLEEGLRKLETLAEKAQLEPGELAKFTHDTLPPYIRSWFALSVDAQLEKRPQLVARVMELALRYTNKYEIVDILLFVLYISHLSGYNVQPSFHECITTILDACLYAPSAPTTSTTIAETTPDGKLFSPEFITLHTVVRCVHYIRRQPPDLYAIPREIQDLCRGVVGGLPPWEPWMNIVPRLVDRLGTIFLALLPREGTTSLKIDQRLRGLSKLISDLLRFDCEHPDVASGGHIPVLTEALLRRVYAHMAAYGATIAVVFLFVDLSYCVRFITRSENLESLVHRAIQRLLSDTDRNMLVYGPLFSWSVMLVTQSLRLTRDSYAVTHNLVDVAVRHLLAPSDVGHTGLTTRLLELHLGDEFDSGMPTLSSPAIRETFLAQCHAATLWAHLAARLALPHTGEEFDANQVTSVMTVVARVDVGLLRREVLIAALLEEGYRSDHGRKCLRMLFDDNSEAD